MAISDTIRTTPITTKADRRDQRVRLIEESVLLVRGDWPAVATGLCESVNRAAGLVFPKPRALDEAIRQTCRESLRLVEHLYGVEAAVEVQRLAAVGPGPNRRRRRRGPRPAGQSIAISTAVGSPRAIPANAECGAGRGRTLEKAALHQSAVDG